MGSGVVLKGLPPTTRVLGSPFNSKATASFFAASYDSEVWGVEEFSPAVVEYSRLAKRACDRLFFARCWALVPPHKEPRPLGKAWSRRPQDHAFPLPRSRLRAGDRMEIPAP